MRKRNFNELREQVRADPSRARRVDALRHQMDAIGAVRLGPVSTDQPMAWDELAHAFIKATERD